MQPYSVYLRPEDPASGLPEYATCLEAHAANIACSKALVLLAELRPDDAHLYASPVASEDRPDLPRPVMNALSEDFLKAYRWDEENQVFAERPQADSKPVNFDALSADQKMAVLVRHGTTEINSEQLKDALKLQTTEKGTPEGHILEALVRAKSIPAMHPEAVLQLIDEMGNHFDATDSWPRMVKFCEAWLKDRQAARKESSKDVTTLRTASGATAGGSRPTDRSSNLNHNLDSLGIEIGLALSRKAFDIYEIPSEEMTIAKEMVRRKDPEWDGWFKALSNTPGILDFSRASIICLIKFAPANIHLNPGALQSYINKTLTETDHASPDPATVAAACGPVPVNQGEADNETQPDTSVEEQPLADAAPETDAVEQDPGKQDGAAAGLEEQPPVSERTGPFYLRNTEGDLKRANKVRGLEDLLAQGYSEITKDEWLGLKKAAATIPDDNNQQPEGIPDLPASNVAINTEAAPAVADTQAAQSDPEKTLIGEWGLEIIEERFIPAAPILEKESCADALPWRIARDGSGSPVTCTNYWLKVAFWCRQQGRETREIVAYGSAPYISQSDTGIVCDTDAPNKSLLNAINNAKALLGLRE